MDGNWMNGSLVLAVEGPLQVDNELGHASGCTGTIYSKTRVQA
jgi:hypothetical protein